MEDRLVTISEVLDLLNDEKEERELSYEQRMAQSHAETFAKLPVKKEKKLIKELVKFERIDLAHAIKIADILPDHPDDLRAIFAKDRFDLEPEEIEQVLEIIAKLK